jgi:hypothetical protein
MYKFGYAYTSKGRQLIVGVTRYTNTQRYSNKVYIPMFPKIDTSIFETVLPVTLTKDMNHLSLSQKISRFRSKTV